MNFTVVWLPGAGNELAAVWNAAPDRNAVAAAANELDGRLRRNPVEEGESRVGDQRITFTRPLGIYFTVDPTARLVQVFHVWWYD